MSGEFNLVQQYFSRPSPDAVLGGGDDCALLQATPGMQLAVSTDTLVTGVHFFPDADPSLLGWKSMAVNISDLAAMGATPRWATLAITLPYIDDEWLAAYADGLYRCATQYGVNLVGGDTTRGALSMTFTVIGEVPAGQALRRDGAKPGDTVWVSGTLGEAAFALAAIQGQLNLSDTDFAILSTRLHAPTPRVALGLALRQLATSAIDISDGLLADLGHILQRSHVGAELDYTRIPVSEIVHDLAAHPAFDRCVLAGGDDYELCFTAPAHRHDAIAALSASLNVRLTAIGQISAIEGLRLMDADGQRVALDSAGFDHFAS